MRNKTAYAAALLVLLLSAGAPLSAQGIRGRELFGVRIGGSYSPSTLDPVFGRGSALEIHFLHGLTQWGGIDVALSSNDFGASNDQLKNIDFTGTNSEVDLQIYSLTVGFAFLTQVSKHLTPTVEAGPGLYSVNAVLPQGFFQAQKSEFRVGFYGGVGAIVGLTRSFSLNLNAKYHYIFSGAGYWDTIHFYTAKSRTQMYEITLGMLITTGF
jgi:hypothetical protein